MKLFSSKPKVKITSNLIHRPLWIVALIASLAWLGMGLLGSVTKNPMAFVFLYLMAFVAYYFGVRHVLTQRQTDHSLTLILLAGLLLRLLVFGGAPSDDIYRYLWEGEVQRYGMNPYVLPPDAIELSQLRENNPHSTRMNHPSWSAIYPPVAMLWHRLFGHSVLMLKASFLFAEMIMVFFLWRLLGARQISTQQILIYWWNPLPILALSFEGHHDAVSLAFFMAALYALVALKKEGLGVITWTAAVLSKGFALVAWPALWTRVKPATWLWALPVGLLVSLPFIDAGPTLWQSLFRFGGELHYNDSLHALFVMSLDSLNINNPLGSRLLSFLTWIGILFWVMTRVRPDPLLRTAWLLGALLLVLPTVHQWYMLTLLPLLCFFPWTGWILLTGTCILPYLAQYEIVRTGEWVEWHWLKPFEYAPLFFWFLWISIKRWRQSHPHQPGLSPADRHEGSWP